MSGDVRVVGLATPHRFDAGDDLAAVLRDAATAAGVPLADGDVVAVASKVVSLVEDAALTPAAATAQDADPRRATARALAAEIVVDSPRVLVTRTAHGFVAANGGIDASNAAGRLLALPVDPDASAARLRARLAAGPRDTAEDDGGAGAKGGGVDVGVVVTDSFGRPWRTGQTDVALGVAGIPALRDERGGTDLDGRPLHATLAAIADAVAAAGDLVRTKASGTPFVLLRGTGLVGAPGPTGGRALLRDRAEDLFAHGGGQALLAGLAARRTVRRFTDAPVADHLVEDAVRAALTAASPDDARPWAFVRLSPTTRRRVLDARDERGRHASDGSGARPDDRLRAAPVLLVAVARPGARRHADPTLSVDERDRLVLAGGAAVQQLLVALAAVGLGAAWEPVPAVGADVLRGALGLSPDTVLIGLVAVGHAVPEVADERRATVDLADHLWDR